MKRIIIYISIALVLSAVALGQVTQIGPVNVPYIDIPQQSTPGLPASGICRMHFDLAANVMQYLNSSGGNCAAAGSVAAGGSPFQIQVNNSGVLGGITNVAAGSELVSQGASSFPVFRPLTYTDIRDLGIDCTGTTDVGATFNAISWSNLYVNVPNPCLMRTTIELVIQGQANFVIHGNGTRVGTNGVVGPAIFGCNPAASTPVLYINRSGYFTIEGIGIWSRGATPCNTSTFTGAIQLDSTGAPGVTTHNMLLKQVGLFTNPQGGTISGWIGLNITDGGQQNGEMVSVEDSIINCENSPSSIGIYVNNGTSDNDNAYRNNIQTCMIGIQSKGNIRIVNNLFTSVGDFTTFGRFGANILVSACSSGQMNILYNEEDSGGPFIDNDHTGSGGCQSGFNLIGNMIGVTDVNSGDYIIDVGNSGTSEAWNLMGNTFLVTSNTAQYVMGSLSQSANHGALAQLMDLGGNFLRPPTLSNTLGISNPNLSFEGGETHVGLVGAFLPSPQSPQGNVDSTTPSRIWYPTNPTGNTFKSQSPFLGLRSYYAASSLADDWLWQSIADANQSALIFNHNAGAAPTAWFGWDGQVSGIKSGQLATPGPPTGVTNIGAAGSTTYTYAIVAFGITGNTAGSTTLSTTTGNATLNSTNYNFIQWVPTLSIGANQWCVWRTVSGGTPSTTGKIGCVKAVATTTNAQNGLTYFLNDQGLAGDSTSLPATNTTGLISIPNGNICSPAAIQFAAGTSNGISWDNPSLGIGFCTGTANENANLSGTGAFSSFYVSNNFGLGFSSLSSTSAGGPDTKFNRLAPQVVTVNSGTANDETALLRWNTCKPTAAINMSSSGTPVTICTWTLPALAKTWSWQCSGTYSVSTTSDTFAIGMNAAQAPTSETGNAQISSTLTGTLTASSATATASGNQNILTGASVSTVTSIPWSSSGTIQASATSGAFAITGTLTGTSPSGTVNVGSTCLLY